MDLHGEERRVRPLRRAVERAQALVRQYVPQDVHLTPSAERRAEAAREGSDRASDFG